LRDDVGAVAAGEFVGWFAQEAVFIGGAVAQQASVRGVAVGFQELARDGAVEFAR